MHSFKCRRRFTLSLCLVIPLAMGNIVSLNAIAQNTKMDEDSLLPPEVVPIGSSNTANSEARSGGSEGNDSCRSGSSGFRDERSVWTHGASDDRSERSAMQKPTLPPLAPPIAQSSAPRQAPSAAGQISRAGSESIPGLSGNNNTSISPQDYRKAVFDSLMNQEKAIPLYLPQYSSQKLDMLQAQMENQSQNNLGLSPLVTPQFNGGMAQSDRVGLGSVQGYYPAYAQTLAGSVRNPVAYRPSKLAGFSHAISLASLFGVSALSGIYAGRRSPYGYYSLGLLGLGLANYGIRNGFRF